MTPPLLPRLLFLLSLIAAATATSTDELAKGFSARPDSLSASGNFLFQSLVKDPSGKFSFGFLQKKDDLDVAVVHVPSGFPVWQAGAAAGLGGDVSLAFDGILQFSDGKAALWKAGSKEGSKVKLNPSSNLLVLAADGSTVWESFDHPFDTLVSGQNLTRSSELTSPDSQFALRLGADFMGLYMGSVLYWKMDAQQTDGSIAPDGPPIYARLNQTGYLALFQNETTRIHVEPFEKSNRNLTGLWRLTLKEGGALKAYFWNDTDWLLSYEPLSEPCRLPSQCGAYSLCITGEPEQCQCLEGGPAGSCHPSTKGNLCTRENFSVIKRAGVELAYSDLLPFEVIGSLDECELRCERNCSCWGALYNNQSRHCVFMDFPVETLVKAADNRLGYFKLRSTPQTNGGADARTAVLAIALSLVAVISLTAAFFLWRRRQRRQSTLMGQDLPPGGYDEFEPSSSFRDVELSSNKQ